RSRVSDRVRGEHGPRHRRISSANPRHERRGGRAVGGNRGLSVRGRRGRAGARPRRKQAAVVRRPHPCARSAVLVDDCKRRRLPNGTRQPGRGAAGVREREIQNQRLTAKTAPRPQSLNVIIYTIGHSTRSIEDFIALLRAHGVTQLADVRTVPKSRRHPHFAREALLRSLPAAGIDYRHVAALGGLRKPRSDSGNTAWRHEGFRGYADYMETPGFDTAL